jgi:hypothetical protein
LKKEILSDDFKKRKIFWKNIAENFLENFPYGKIFHLTSLDTTRQENIVTVTLNGPVHIQRQRDSVVSLSLNVNKPI